MNDLKMRIDNRIDLYLSDTRIENLFINEFLPSAPGDCVKVYVFGIMYAQHQQRMDLQTMAKALGMSIEEVKEAFAYWARRGAVHISADEQGDYKIVFISQRNALYGMHDESSKQGSEKNIVIESADESDGNGGSGAGVNSEGNGDAYSGSQEKTFDELMNDEIRGLYNEYEQVTGRPVSNREINRINDAINTYSITPAVMYYSMKYCSELEKYSIDYISAVALRWTQEGCRTIEEVKELLDRHSQRSSEYGKIFKAVGFNRTPSPADREMMDRWFDDWNYKLSDVLEACKKTAGQREPSLKYVDKVLENKYLEAGGIVVKRNDGSVVSTGGRESQGTQRQKAHVSQRVLHEYYEYLRREADIALDARIDEVCAKVAEMREIFNRENELNRQLLSMSFASDGKEKRKQLREESLFLQEEKKRILRENAYPEDYLEKKYKCPRCKDTGETDEGRVCSCAKARSEEAYLWHTKR